MAYPCRAAVPRAVANGSCEDKYRAQRECIGRRSGIFRAGDHLVSPDGKHLAYLTDSTGFRQFKLQLRERSGGGPVRSVCPGVTSIAWDADSTTIYYVTEDGITKRPYRLYAHQSGSAPDQLLYEERDASFRLALQAGRQGRHLFLNLASATSSEVRYLDARATSKGWQTLRPCAAEVLYDAEPRDGRFYLRINEFGDGYHIITGTPDQPATWHELVAHRPGVRIDQLELFSRFMVLHERTQGLQQLTVRDLHSGRAHPIAFSDGLYDVGASENRQWNSTRFRYTYQAPATPRSVIEHDMASEHNHVLGQAVLSGTLRPSDYVSERRNASADDATAPLHLSAHGAYGSSSKLRFSSARLSLLERVVIIAIAHVRGGGEFGQQWHDGGRRANRMNTFTDFIRCAETLVAEGYTNSSRMVAQGRSAGGLLIGAVVNLRPELFKAAVAVVPFVDVLNTMLDPTLPLVVGEYAEWGNPATTVGFAIIRAYSPYENLHAQTYPAMLVKAGFNDS